MLNRRILRVKAMQALYSYYLAEESLKQVTREQLESHFYPDPAKDDFSESEHFERRRKEASRLYEEYLPGGEADIAVAGVEEEITEQVQDKIGHYYKQLKSEEKNILNAMLRDIDGIRVQFLKILALPLELAHIEKLEKEKRENAQVRNPSGWQYHFINHPVIEALTKFETFNKLLHENQISWAGDQDTIRDWYKEIIRKNEAIREYQHQSDPSLEVHHEMLLHLLKKVVFKDEVITDYFSGHDIRWIENRPIVSSLVVKTVQSFDSDSPEPFQLKEVSKNEEEDLEFFEELFKKTIEKDKFLDEIIAKRTKNWDISRVALTDRIILKMALTEMMTFSSIPIKVTINEFIEVSKIYSTPKSKQFINGILDVLSNELTSEGVIKKSGRGLIDNK